MVRTVPLAVQVRGGNIHYHARRPILPQEICDMIIDMASDYVWVLTTYALVSRHWLPRARMHIFHLAIFEHRDTITTFLSVISSPLLDAGLIPRYVRELTLGKRLYAKMSEKACRDQRLVGLLDRFVSLETLRIQYVIWREVRDVTSSVRKAIINVSRRISHLHVHDVYFDSISDMLHLLSSAPHRSLLCLTRNTTCRLEFDTKIKPIHNNIHVDTLAGDIYGYARLCLYVRGAYLTGWPFSINIGEVSLVDNDDSECRDPMESGPIDDEEYHDFIEFIKMYNVSLREQINLGMPLFEDAPSRYMRFPNLVVQTVRIQSPAFLHTKTQFIGILVECLECMFIFPRKICIVLPATRPSDHVSAAEVPFYARLDRALSNAVSEEPRPEVVFETSQPVDQLVAWTQTVSRYFPLLIASGARVGVVCQDGENGSAAEKWW